MGKVLLPNGDSSVRSDDCTASKSMVLAPYTAVTSDSDDEPVQGTMPNLTVKTPIQHSTGNGTKVIKGDACYLSANTDGASRLQIRYNDKPGFITANTLFGIEIAKVASTIGLNSGVIRAGNNVLGIQGDPWVVWTGDSTADVSQVLAGKTYWQNGVKKTGTMLDRRKFNGSPGINSSYPNVPVHHLTNIQRSPATNGITYLAGRPPVGFYSGGGDCYAGFSDADLRSALGITADKILKGNTICGISGTVEGYVPGAGDILYKSHNTAGWVGKGAIAYIESGTAYARIHEGLSISKGNSYGWGWQCSAKAAWVPRYKKLNIYVTNTSSSYQWYCSACHTAGSGDWAADARYAKDLPGQSNYSNPVMPGTSKIIQWDITPFIITFDNCMTLEIRFSIKNKSAGYTEDSLIVKRIWLE